MEPGCDTQCAHSVTVTESESCTGGAGDDAETAQVAALLRNLSSCILRPWRPGGNQGLTQRGEECFNWPGSKEAKRQ